MTTPEIKELLEQFNSDRISAEGLTRLHDLCDRDGNDLKTYLADEWYGYEGDIPLSESKKDNLFQEVSSRIWRSRNRMSLFFAGAAAVLLLGVCLFMGADLWHKGKEIREISRQEINITSAPEGSSEVILPDGSKVILNSRSSLSYKSDYGRKDRRVTLCGEAYFMVAPTDGNKRFIVSTDKIEIRDIGTEFNVYAYPEMDVIETSLIKGEVKVSSDRQSLHLSPGEKALYFKSSGRLQPGRRVGSIETVWLEDNLVFNHSPLSEVFETMERKFGVIIHTPPSIKLSDHYTGTFSDRRVSAVLDILKLHYGFDYHIDGAEIFIE